MDIIVGKVEDQVIVPITAVVDDNSNGSVIKIVNGETQRVPVTTGFSNGLKIVI